MTPARARRTWVWRALLSALAGGGISAATLGAISPGAIAAETTNGSAAEGATTTSTSTEAQPTEPTKTESTSTSTTPTSTSTTTQTQTTSTTSTPATTTTTTTSTTPTTTAASQGEAEVPVPAKPKTKSKHPSVVLQSSQESTASKAEGSAAEKKSASAKQNEANNVASAPDVIAAQYGALEAELSGSAASTAALSFYRIPLFLLPIYQAASEQYGVPWQILAAINEIETDYGTDLSVSTAGAVGWMQFEPATWLQYGVDALNSGYADPYNPVDAIFAAARYLRAAGAATNLHAAILAYNHSEEYVASVLLRAKLIASYPKSVIATLTGLTEGELPLNGSHVTWGELSSEPASTKQTASEASSTSTATGQPATSQAGDASGSAKAPTPAAAAASSQASGKSRAPVEFVEVMSSPGAKVLASQDGRIVKLGYSQKLGNYVVLRDVYGDVYTYAGLATIAKDYRKPKRARAAGSSSTSQLSVAVDTGESKPTKAATEGAHPPVTLKVKSHPAAGSSATAATAGSSSASSGEPTAVSNGKVRTFAHPGNPDALASAAGHKARRSRSRDTLPLRVGAIVSKGTVLGHASTPSGAKDAHLRFSIKPGGDSSTIDPRPILENWSELSTALHPQGTSGETDLLGATASGVFLMTAAELQRTVLSDPNIEINAPERQKVASGAVDKRVLAVLEFLSRIGLKPTVGKLGADTVDISAVNDISIAGHQGSGSITDLTIRALLTLTGEFAPERIVSLMKYPGDANTISSSANAGDVHVAFTPQGGVALSRAAASKVAHSSSKGKTAPVPVVSSVELSSSQWNELDSRIGGLAVPKVSSKRSSAAIKDDSSSSSDSSGKH